MKYSSNLEVLVNTLISQGVAYDDIYFSSKIGRHSPKHYIDAVAVNGQSARIKVNDGLLMVQSKFDERSIDCILYDDRNEESIFIQSVADQLLNFELDVILQEHSGIEAMLAKSILLPSIETVNCHSLAMMRTLFALAFSGLYFEVFSKSVRQSSPKKIFRLAEDQLSGYLTLGRFAEYSVKRIEINIYADVSVCQSKLHCLERILSAYRESFINHQVIAYSVFSSANHYGQSIKAKILSRSKLDYRRVKVYEKVID
ncbi:hypothetical protein BGC07_19070 [Piscirickettsia litoralis]|uniref:Uncharacterized protein n=1 Tax=Piscirickettsia litoralis TaxID=1891921 RepID=A0ABX2ZXI2_9GAMM|nr:hypothetical protein BGC07_19070 [Piscirickettsia litoralis]